MFPTLSKFAIKLICWISFASSIMKSIVMFPTLSKFAIKLICSISLGSKLRACSLLKSIEIFLQFSLK